MDPTHRWRQYSPPSPTSTSTGDDEESPIVGRYPHRGPGTGTLRSSRSVPALALATWDGEPCPVHGRGYGGLLTPPSPAPGHFRGRHGGSSVLGGGGMGPYRAPGGLERKPFHGSLPVLVPPPAVPSPPPLYPHLHGMPPPHLLPPYFRPRPYVIPAFEPLPVRDPYKARTPVPPFASYKADRYEDMDDSLCCKGHLIVLWIILGVVTVGVVLGIVLGVTMT